MNKTEHPQSPPKRDPASGQNEEPPRKPETHPPQNDQQDKSTQDQDVDDPKHR